MYLMMNHKSYAKIINECDIRHTSTKSFMLNRQQSIFLNCYLGYIRVTVLQTAPYKEENRSTCSIIEIK